MLFAFPAAAWCAADPADLLARFQRQENWRAGALRDYEVLRRYSLTAARIGEAAMGVRMSFAQPGRKEFEILWTTGSPTLQNRVFRKVIEAELEAATAEMRGQTRFSAQNYTFRPVGPDTLDGRAAFVYELTPRDKRKFLVRGRIWLDAEDASLLRIEGEPSGVGSFWVRRVRVIQNYRKVDGFWLVASQRSEADVRFFGTARLSVEYSDYRVNRSLLAERSRSPALTNGGPGL